MRYILDTDHVALLLSQHPLVQDRAHQEYYRVTVTTTSVDEILNIWLNGYENEIVQANRLPRHQVVYAISWFFKDLQLLTYSKLANEIYQRLITENAELGKQSWRREMEIAAIALVNGDTVVTRNIQIFGLVPGLAIEDWSV